MTEMTAAQTASMLLIELAVPGWIEIVNSRAFLIWLLYQPSDYQQAMLNSWDPEMIQACIEAFRKHELEAE